jgi:hypothetical protein
VIHFRSPNRWFSLSLSFKTEQEPDPQQVIAALEEVIRKLRDELQSKT